MLDVMLLLHQASEVCNAEYGTYTSRNCHCIQAEKTAQSLLIYQQQLILILTYMNKDYVRKSIRLNHSSTIENN